MHNTQFQKQGGHNTCNHENNVPSWLSSHWLCGNSCTWAHDVGLYIAGINESESAQQAKLGKWHKWS